MSKMKFAFNAVYGILALAVVMLLAGCLSPFDSPRTALPSSEGTGSVILTIGGENGRTIQPKTVLSDFLAYRLEFTAEGFTIDPIDRLKDDLSDPIELPAGTWDLTITAYMDEAQTKPAAQGKHEGIVIAPSGSTKVQVELAAMAGGSGTFSWNITFPANVEGNVTVETILTDGAKGTEQYNQNFEGTLHYNDDGVAVNRSYESSVILASGSYRVKFKLSETDGDADIEYREILQVYNNLDSLFEKVFEQQYFNIKKVTKLEIETWAKTSKDATAYTDKTNSEVPTGRGLKLIPIFTPDNASFQDIVWSIDSGNGGGTNAEIVTVIEKIDNKDVSTGIFYATNAVEGGSTATVTARILHGWGFGETAIYTFPIKVTYVPISSIEQDLEQEFLYIPDKTSVRLTVTIEPDNATNKKLTWNVQKLSGDMTINDGLFTAISPGTANVTASAPGLTALQWTITVNTVPVEKVTLNIPNILNGLRMNTNDEAQLIALISPWNATNQAVTWSTAAENIATVVGGKVTYKGGSGTSTTITVTSVSNPSATASCEVSYQAATGTAVAGVVLNTAPTQKVTGALHMIENEKVILTAIINPLLATNQNLFWVSSDPTIVSVNNVYGIAGTTTVELTAEDIGDIEFEIEKEKKATIIVTTRGGGYTAQCEVTVRKTADAVADADEITLNTGKAGEITLNTGAAGAATLIASVLTASGANNAANKKVFWVSSDSSAATVDQSGKVTGITAGKSATIMATTEDRGIVETCTVQVVGGANAVKATGVTLNIEDLSLPETQKEAILIATVLSLNEEGLNKEVIWSTSNPAVATVADGVVDEVTGVVQGKITTVGIGTANITVTTVDGGKTKTCVVTVREAGLRDITNLDLSVNTIAQLYNTYYKLDPVFTPVNALIRDLVWTTSDSNIVQLVNDARGNLYLKNPGFATITVTSRDGGYTAQCEVEVIKVLVDRVELNISPVTLPSGKTLTLIATVYPSNATIKDVSWTATGTGATVAGSGTNNLNGVVTYAAAGVQTTITVSSVDDPTKTATTTVNTVLSSAGDITGITLSADRLNLEMGKTATLIASVEPVNASNPTVRWYSNNPKAATVGTTNGLITPVSPDEGTATIYATTLNGGYTKTCVVTVRAAGSEGPPVGTIELNITAMNLAPGATADLIPTIQPRSAGNEALAANKDIIWTTSDRTVATVDQTGRVSVLSTAAANSTAIITATTVDGGHREQRCTVTAAAGTNVTSIKTTTTTETANAPHMTRLTLSLGNPGDPEIQEEWRARTLVATVLPGTAAQGVKWYSSNPAVATVTDDGKVEAKTAGEATIIATTTRSGRAVQCAVTVLPANSDKEPVLRVTLTPAASQLSITIGKENNALTHVTRENDRSYTPALRGVTNSAEVLLSANVEWVTNNAAVATVSSTGVVSGVTPGTTRIYAISVEGARTAYRDVTVTGVPVTGIVLSAKTVYSSSGVITATVTPGNAFNKTINWTSGTTAVATVSPASSTITNGTLSVAATTNATISPISLTTIKGGSTVITARAADGSNRSAARTIRPLAVRSITGHSDGTFNMTTYQITQELYTAVRGSNPSNFSSSPTSGETQGYRPVDSVSWYDAVYFCNLLSAAEGLTSYYNLPSGTPPANETTTWNNTTTVSGANGWRLATEAQWEYACKAGTTTTFYWGANWNSNYGWITDNSNSRTHEVGLKTANGYGLYDMSGNVNEWCWDIYSGRYRVVCGGSWYNSSSYATSSYRSYYYPYNQLYYIGLRLVRP